MLVVFAAYGILAGAFVPDAGFPPTRWFNYDHFFAVVGAPIHITVTR